MSNVDVYELAESLQQWSAEPISMVELALRLACVDRVALEAAYPVLYDEVRILAEEDVDEFYRAHGRYMTDDERAKLLCASKARPRRGFSDPDRVQLEQLVLEAVAEVRVECPNAPPSEQERLVLQRLRRMADRGRPQSKTALQPASGG